MRVNTRMFWILAAFFVAAGIAYTIWTAIDYQGQGAQLNEIKAEQGIEWVGTIAIFLTAVLSAFIAFYIGRTYKAQGGELPEDRLDADIDDGDAEQGFFSPWSWWPIMLAAGAATIFLGLAVGAWIAFIGIGFTVISLVGWQYEYYRGNFGR